MDEVFLALKPYQKDDACSIIEPGRCVSTWLCDELLVAQHIRDGWCVYRCNGFQRVLEVDIEIKMEKQNGKCAESTKSDNKCRR